jgi:hypothetical protein
MLKKPEFREDLNSPATAFRGGWRAACLTCIEERGRQKLPENQ